jgi:hypothetical protein
MKKNTLHCLLCEHKKVNFTSGVYCGISGNKPKFIEKCSSKEFDEIMEQKIIELNSNFKLIENKKSGIYLHLYTFLTISLIILITDFFLTLFLWETGWVTSLSITVGVIGLGMIPYAINPLKKFKYQLKTSQNSILELNSILNIYNIQYEIKTTILKGPHDIIDIDSTLTMLKNKRKDYTKKLNQSNAKITIDY